MLKKQNIRNIIALFFLAAVLTVFMAPDIAEARRGGSFGGRSRSRTTRSRPAKRPMTKQQRAAKRQRTVTTQKRTPSFGGKRISSSAARSKYGTPRKTTPMTGKNAYGTNQNYNVHSYGGFSSGLMTGYMMGSITSSMMWMPWRGSFWYSRPYYTEPDANGNISVYPPTFSWTKVFFALVVIGVIIYIIRGIIRNKKRISDGGGGSFG
ncbi:MAG: hypothetical protein PF588_08830 [Candidatus Kapabacteria bacterium]|jgi:hypothetical protein|nr:hypothetical protein [Candidatus Kapabacteria bacterium]